MQHARRKTIGIRVPDNVIAQALLAELGEPLLSSTLIMPGADMPMTDAEEIRDTLGKRLDLVIDGGYCGFEPTTVVDLVAGAPEIRRVGKGATETLV